MHVPVMVLVASLLHQHCCVWSSRATPCNSMAHCQEYNLHLIMQHASCHACLLIINISETSANSPLFRSRKKPETVDAGQVGWRDTHIRIEGPAVAEFQREFLRSWEASKGKPVAVSPDFWPPTRP